MRKYKIVQTGPKIQFGGLNLGFFSLEYHRGIDLILNTAPNNPAI